VVPFVGIREQVYMTMVSPARVPLATTTDAQSAVEPLVVRVDLACGGYDIVVGPGLLSSLGELARVVGAGQGLLVADDTVAGLYGEVALQSLREAGCRVCLATVPPGEDSKTLAQAERLYEACLTAGLDRGSTIFALGGGVVGDLAGFVAGTFMRGIRFVQAPTTLLAQVDASVGGKTAVDLPQAKNVVGVFHQPALVVADTEALETLPEREFRGGLAEVVKHAAIADVEMFAYLQAQSAEVLARAPYVLRALVARNCQIKAEVVRADPRESGLRAVLNYGHTIGHALERAAATWDLRHGEAVAHGMVAEARVAEELGVAGPGLAKQLTTLLAALGLATDRPRVEASRALTALRHDKKLESGRLRLPLVPRPGEVVLRDDVALEVLGAALTETLG